MGHTHPYVQIRQIDDLTLEVFEDIVWNGRTVVLDEELLAHLAATRAAMESALTSGDAVYGVNTGMGYLSTVRLSDGEQEKHGANMFLGRAVGGPPYLDRDEARAVLLARLAGLLSGHAGATPSLCTFIVDRLNDDFVPAIPRTNIGCAGEIIPLSHAFGTFLGIGQIIEGGATMTAASGLAQRGVAPYTVALKEGIALLAGAPGTLALAIATHRRARMLARQIVVCWACAIDAMQIPHDPYDPAIADLTHDPIMSTVLRDLRTFLDGARADPQVTQGPVSFRVIPQVLVHLHRTLDSLSDEIRRNISSVTDSPAFYEGRFISNGGFHAIGLASQMDTLCIALVQVAELCGQHVHRALDHRFSRLPDQLTANPGPQAGLVVVHKRMTGAIHALRRLAMPATVGSMDTSLGQEDAMAFGFEAAEKLARAEDLLFELIACEFFVCRQAWALRGTSPGHGLRDIANIVTEAIEPIHVDRQLGLEIDAFADFLRGGGLQ